MRSAALVLILLLAASLGHAAAGLKDRLWGEYCCHMHDFQPTNTRHCHALPIQPRLGLRCRQDGTALPACFTARLGADLGQESWNHHPWSNNIQHGPGIRLLSDRSAFKKGLVVFLHAEHLKVDYLAKVEHSARQRISRFDDRVDLEFWVPFGAHRMTRYASC